MKISIQNNNIIKKRLTKPLSYVIIITESTDDGCFRTYS